MNDEMEKVAVESVKVVAEPEHFVLAQKKSPPNQKKIVRRVKSGRVTPEKVGAELGKAVDDLQKVGAESEKVADETGRAGMAPSKEKKMKCRKIDVESEKSPTKQEVAAESEKVSVGPVIVSSGNQGVDAPSRGK